MNSKNKVCFMCTKDNSEIFVEVDDDVSIDIEYLLPDITITKLNIMLFICSTCYDKLKSFSEFKQVCSENSQLLESSILVKSDIWLGNTIFKKPFPKPTSIKLNLVPSETDKQKTTSNIVNPQNISSSKEQEMFKDENIVTTIKENEEKIIPKRRSARPLKKTKLETKVEEKCTNNKILTKKVDKRTVYCLICNNRFSTSLIKVHMKEHNTKKSYKCCVCESAFVTYLSLKIHQKIHVGIKNYQCMWCGKSFIQESHLETHNKTHSQEKTFRCFICNELFVSIYNLRRHLRKMHFDDIKVQTNIKEKLANDNSDHENPTEQNKTNNLSKENSENQEIRNKECAKNVTKSNSDTQKSGVYINKSEKTNKNSELITSKQIVICINKCSDSELNIPKNNNKGSDENKTENSPSIKKRKLLQRKNIKPKYSNLKIYSCPFCDKKFLKQLNLKIHLNIHKLSEFKCKICKKCFPEKAVLKYHNNTKQLSKCKICDRPYVKSYLTRHLRTHYLQTNFKCSKCPKNFILNKHLKDHVKIHDKSQDILTPRCNGKFIRKNKHKKNYSNKTHSRCLLCNKFILKTNLSTHMKKDHKP